MRIYSKTEPLLDVGTFKSKFLFGVELRDKNGVDIPDVVLESYISAAIDYIEMELNCPILPVRLENEPLDYKLADYKAFMFVNVPTYPIVKGSVEKIRLNFTNLVGIDFPPEWYKVYETAGQIQLLPTISSMQSVIIMQAGQLIPRAINAINAPQLIWITYKAGICNEDGKVPAIVNQAIGLGASIGVLEMLGNMTFGANGVSALSLSLDGLSQSLSTVAGPTSNLFGATIGNYKTMLDKTIMPLLRKKFKRVGISFI